MNIHSTFAGQAKNQLYFWRNTRTIFYVADYSKSISKFASYKEKVFSLPLPVESSEVFNQCF